MKKIFFLIITMCLMLQSGCSSPARSEKRGTIIESAQGITGKIVVMKDGGDLVLLVNDVVQGRRSLEAIKSDELKGKLPEPDNKKTGADNGGGFLELPDPIAQMAGALKPEPVKVLLIGLGTGKTAMDLQNMGLWVESVEIEPKIIEFARKYFGFRGKAFAADGADFIKTTWRRYDVIILDAFAGLSLPEKLVSPEALTNYQKILTPDGTIILRLYADPEGWEFSDLMERFDRERFGYIRFFTEIPRDGKQFLYLKLNAGNSRIISENPIPLYELYGHDSMSYTFKQFQVKAEKKFTLTGYVIRYGPEKVLCLDLPHTGMGATRVVLKGNTEILEKSIAGIKGFPSRGHLPSDGDGKSDFWIGSWAPWGAEGRSSPVVAAVTGKLGILGEGMPYDLKNLHVFHNFSFHKLIPYGEILYEMEVQKIEFILTSDQWKKCSPKEEPPDSNSMRTRYRHFDDLKRCAEMNK